MMELKSQLTIIQTQLAFMQYAHISIQNQQQSLNSSMLYHLHLQSTDLSIPSKIIQPSPIPAESMMNTDIVLIEQPDVKCQGLC